MSGKPFEQINGFYPVAVSAAALLGTAAVCAFLAMVPSLREIAHPVGGVSLFLGGIVGARAAELAQRRHG